MTKHNSAAGLVLALLAVLGLDGHVAAQQQVPFIGRLEGSFTLAPIPGTTDGLVLARGIGQATLLGRFSFDFPLKVSLVNQTGTGTYVLTAANGDTVLAKIAAQSAILPNGLRRVLENGIICGGTGRFRLASGSFTTERFLNPATGGVTGSFIGTISAPGP